MSDVEAIEMDEEERDAFLGAGGTGVIALSDSEGEPPHAVPVSYGYDMSEDVFYFRLAAGEESSKGNLRDRAVTFVTYGRPDDEWWSVIAKGRLRSTTEESIAIESLEGLQQVQIPLVEIFDRPTSEVTFEFYRLKPEKLTTRKESPTGQ
ncbi:pyridoxamine 5'-phosphate oxidase family protein [Natronomonas salina]|uniref:pyridoxamine 5'-phosphate oxidase family protein n=1 Tax=Natronomonas salina TaxID=1710540 RepID=UPI0015B5E58D|nr:pyridoxamine 5'-phosphate oxidase family protein [Natronomonas salina]QLD89594.1 pyridoxamine 5'-phosphate oxidase family protein [Natronomonas salina]